MKIKHDIQSIQNLINSNNHTYESLSKESGVPKSTLIKYVKEKLITFNKNNQESLVKIEELKDYISTLEEQIKQLNGKQTEVNNTTDNKPLDENDDIPDLMTKEEILEDYPRVYVLSYELDQEVRKLKQEAAKKEAAAVEIRKQNYAYEQAQEARDKEVAAALEQAKGWRQKYEDVLYAYSERVKELEEKLNAPQTPSITKSLLKRTLAKANLFKVNSRLFSNCESYYIKDLGDTVKVDLISANNKSCIVIMDNEYEDVEQQESLSLLKEHKVKHYVLTCEECYQEDKIRELAINLGNFEDDFDF